MIIAESIANRRFLIVNPLDERLIIQIADARTARRAVYVVICGFALGATPPAAQPLDDLLIVNFHKNNRAKSQTEFAQRFLERFRLSKSARIAVHNQAGLPIGPLKALVQEVVDQHVRNKRPLLVIRSRLLTRSRAQP